MKYEVSQANVSEANVRQPQVATGGKERVEADSLITLHYRLGSGDAEFISTFDASPATLKLGSGELAGPLEACLVGLPAGERHVFLLEPEQAFGVGDPQLVRRIARAELPDSGKIETHALVEFAAPDGSRFTGVVRELDAESALIDFNHPLAGKPLRFEIEIVGIL